jgi:hypothetical protein
MMSLVSSLRTSAPGSGKDAAPAPSTSGGATKDAASQGQGQRDLVDFIATEFDIELKKSPGDTLGMELDPLDNEVMEVCSLLPGMVQSHNDRCAFSDQVRTGDFLVSINGNMGSTSAMIGRFNSDTTLLLKMRRLKPWSVSLKQSAGAIRPSVNLQPNGKSLLVVRTTHQVIKEWNASRPDADIRVNDRILAVNDIAGDAKKMVDEILKASTLKMVIARPLPERDTLKPSKELNVEYADSERIEDVDDEDELLTDNGAFARMISI